MSLDIYYVFGWIGASFIISAYFLLSTKKVKFNSIIYNTLNLFGAFGLAISTFVTKSWPSMISNTIFGIIALFSVFKIIYKFNHKRRK